MNRLLKQNHIFGAGRWLVLLFAILIGASPSMASAKPAASLLGQNAAQGVQGAAQPIDVVVVLDDSGSMATCWPWPEQGTPFGPPCRFPSPNQPSDPDDLRYSAARLLLQLADAGDRIAVVRFDSVAEGIGQLGSMQTIGDGNNQSALINSLQPPTDYFRRGYTRIDLGFELAANLLESVREPGRPQYILLLTDGEPTQPSGSGQQRPRIVGLLDNLRSQGVLTFPVVLCNPTDGCSGEFLREVFADYGVSEATTAQELLRIFSELFSEMKPDRSVITPRGLSGNLQFTTRDPHGVKAMTFVTTQGGITGIRRDDTPMLPRSALSDANINVSVIESDALGAGLWQAETLDNSAFAVVQSNSYPELLNPPPSLANSPASVRYYPAGKTPMLLARAAGPGASEPLFYNGGLPMDSFGVDNLRVLFPPDAPALVRLQLGEDKEPLQLIRSFRLEPRNDLPRAEVFSPLPNNQALTGDGRARFQAGFAGGAVVQRLGATLFVFEENAGEAPGEGRLVYSTTMACNERICSDESFQPVDGRAYRIYYIVHGQIDDLRFSDWVETDLVLEPAVYLRGLPAQLDLAQMPPDGWPVELSASTLQEIGSLAATLTLHNNTVDEEATSVHLDFDEIVPMEGTHSALLRISGLDTLRPGEYTGEITLVAKGPTGLPANVKIRPGATLPLFLNVARPVARLDVQNVDFGEVLFDTSPNFRLNQEFFVPVQFEGKPFKVSAQVAESSCSELTLTAGAVTAPAGQSGIPLQLSSRGPVQPKSCSGMVLLSGPDADYDVFPSQFEWQTRVAGVEWSIVSGDLYLPDWQDGGTRVEQTLLVRFNGKTPFVVQLADVQAVANAALEEGGTPPSLSSATIDMPPVEVSGPPLENGLYAVPITLISRQPIPHDILRGSFYNGNLQLQIAGLAGDVKGVNFNFRSPSIIQRYIAPVVVPVYSFPLVLCTGPLTLLLLLVAVARVRGRNIDEEEIEQAAVAATIQMAPAVAPTSVPDYMSADAFKATAATAADSSWGGTEWSNVWGAAAANDPATTGHSTNGTNYRSTDSDPWTSGW
jgi:hypothetical protein